MITSAHLTALLAAATWRGVCQFLSLALTSAECLINTCTASYSKSRVHMGHWHMLNQYLSLQDVSHQTLELRRGKAPCRYRLSEMGSPQRQAELHVVKIKNGGLKQIHRNFFVRPRALAHLQSQITILVQVSLEGSGYFGQMRAHVCTSGHQKAPTEHLRLEVFVNKSCSSRATGLKALQTFLGQFITF